MSAPYDPHTHVLKCPATSEPQPIPDFMVVMIQKNGTVWYDMTFREVLKRLDRTNPYLTFKSEFYDSDDESTEVVVSEEWANLERRIMPATNIRKLREFVKHAGMFNIERFLLKNVKCPERESEEKSEN